MRYILQIWSMEQDTLCISWKSLPWSLFKRKVFHLQCKIYEAKKRGNYKLIKRLQALLISSKSAHFIATNLLVSSVERDKLSDYEKYTLACSIKQSLKGELDSNKFRFFGYYKNPEFRKILVIQYILRLALEPIHYKRFYWILYGKGEKLFNLIKIVSPRIKRLSNFGWKKVLRFQVSPSLTDAYYNLLVKQINLSLKYRLFIHKSLMMSHHNNSSLENGLVNFLQSLLIDGINSSLDKTSLIYENRSKVGKFSFTYLNTVIYFLRQEDNLYDFVDKLKSFLIRSGLVIELSSISISTLYEGFDFFGWFFKKPSTRKIFIYVSRSSWFLYKKLFKSVLNKSYSSGFKVTKINLLHMKWIQKYQYISKSLLRSKFYFIKRSVFKYTKNLRSLEKKILFESFRFKLFRNV